ncbi:MAG: tetratricopeptide repeat protein [Enhygromyxa sp.]
MEAPPERLDRAAFEAEIGDYEEEYRRGLEALQITPVWGITHAACLLVRSGSEQAAKAIVNGFAEHMQLFFSLQTSPEVKRTCHNANGAVTRPIPPGRLFVVLYHSSDRICVSYRNVYRGIRELAPHVEDCRFVITEEDSRWVDEYRICAGELAFDRGFAEDEFIDDLYDYIEAEAHRRPDDLDWVRFSARQLAGWAALDINRAQRCSKGSPDRKQNRKAARLLLDRARRIDEHEAVVCAQMGHLLRLEQRPEEARQWFERHAALTSTPDELFAAVLASLEAGDHAGARRWIERLLDADPQHQAALQLLALIATREGDFDKARRRAQAAFELGVKAQAAGRPVAPHATLIHRDQLDTELLATYLAHLDPEGPDQRRALATELLCWARLLRGAENRHEAEDLFTRALALDPLDGKVHVAYADFRRGAGLPGSEELLRAALEINPEQLDALHQLGSKAYDKKRWGEAIELLERAVECSSGGYRRQVDGSHLLVALIEEGNRLLELRTESAYESADRLFVRGLELVAKLHFQRAKWFALILRRSAAHTLLGRHTEALAFAEEAMNLRPDSVHAMSELASCLNNLGRYDDALAANDLAAELDPGYWHVPYVRACILAQTDAPLLEIIRLLEQTIELDPSRRRHIAEDPDFDAIRSAPEFMALVDSE